jgi:hypothetical protein
MPGVRRRVKLIVWPYEGLKLGIIGTIISEHARYVVVQWDDFSRPMGMRPEEIATI